MSEAKVLYHEGNPERSGPVVVVGRVRLQVGLDVYSLYVGVWEWRKYADERSFKCGIHRGAEVLPNGPGGIATDSAAQRWGIWKYDELDGIEEWPEEETVEWNPDLVLE